MNNLYNNEKSIIVEYNPEWIAEFEALAAVIGRAFGTHIRAIHHVGSTSIPGMAGKPILQTFRLKPNTQHQVLFLKRSL